MGVLTSGQVKSALFTSDGASDRERMASLMKEVFDYVQHRVGCLYDAVSDISQVLYLMHLARSEESFMIGEVGFNIGFSSLAFLESSASARVVSFEIGAHSSVYIAKDFIDSRYPGRHDLIIGDSRVTLPGYQPIRQGDDFDLFFIDGGHAHEFVSADIHNSCELAKPDAVVVVDDLTPWYPWGVGPTSAWNDAVSGNLINPLEYIEDGVRVDSIQGPADRAWGVGRIAASKLRDR